MIITTPSVADATGEIATIYAEDIQAFGYVPSHTVAMAAHPDAYRAWQGLIGAIARPMDKRRYELVTLAAAAALKSRSCLLAHGKRALEYIEEDELIRVARDFRSAGLSDAEVAMMDFARKVSGDSASMTDADSQRLRDVGFSDSEIVEIALAAAARNYYSRALHALGVDPDVPTGLNAELREALVGRL